MSSYLLSARLEVSGAGDFISDLDNAARAAVNIEQALKGLKGSAVSLDVKGVRDVVSDLERAEQAARATGEQLSKLSTPGAINVTGAAQVADDLERVERTAREADAALRSIDGGGKLGQAAEEASRLHTAMDRLGRGLAYSATDRAFDAIVDGAREAASEIVAFDEAITNAMSIQPQNMPLADGFRDVARTISKDLGIPVSEVAEGFYHLASAGFDAETQMESIGPVARFAKAGLTDLEDATMKGAQAFAIFRSQGRTMAEVLDVLAQASNVSQGDLDSFADSLTNKAGTAAVTFGQSLEDTVAVLAAFAERGIQGKTAGEQYAIVLRDLSIRATKNADEFERMGIKVFDAQGNMRSIIDIIPNLQQAFKGLSDTQTTAELTALGFTLRSQQVILNLLAMGDSAGYMRDRMGEANGVVQTMVDVQLTSLQSKLDRLKAFTIDLAITGMDALFQAGAFLSDTFEPALRAMGPAAEAFSRGFSGVVSAVAPLIGGAILGGIEAIAAALEMIGSFASQHTGAVEAFGAAVAAIAIGAAASSITNLAINFGGPLLASLLGATGAIKAFVVEMAVVARSGSILGAVQGGWEALGNTIRANPVAAIGAFVAALSLMANEVRKSEADAKAFADAIAGAFDTTTTAGMSAATVELRAQAEAARAAAQETRGFSDFLKTTAEIIPFVDFSDTSIDLYDAADAAERLAAELQGVAQETNQAVNALADWATGVPSFGPFVGDIAAMQAEFQRLGEQSGIAAGSVSITADRLREIAARKDIDLSGPWRDWLPVLFEAALVQDSVAQKLRDMGIAADDAAGLAAGATGSISDLGLSAEDAAAQFDDLTSAIEGLISGPMSKLTAEADLAGAFVDLKTATDEWGLSLDAATEGGREVIGALEGAVSAGLEWAKVQADGDPAVYAAKIGELRQAFIDYATGMGLPIEQAQAFADQIGLIPESKATEIVATVTGADTAEAALVELTKTRDAEIVGKAIMDAATGIIDGWTATPRSTTVTAAADVAPAEANLAATTNTPRTAVIGTVTPNAGQANADLDWVARGRELAISAVANASGANHDLDWVARARELGITAFAQVGGANADIEWASRDRVATIYVQTVGAAAAAAVVGLFSANGGVIDYYANGGMRENHVAQIAPAGAWRVWAEPETGGESYIPLASSKRNRSLQVWRETGRRLGVMGYANGGINAETPVARMLAVGGGETKVVVSAGAIQANVSAAVGANPDHLAALIGDAIQPALDEFALDLATKINRRRGR